MRNSYINSSMKLLNKYSIFLFILLIASFLIQKNNFILTNSLDTSWMFTLNYASSNQYLFGKDIVFTFGPLGFIGYPISEGLTNTLVAVAYIIKGLYLLYLGLIIRDIIDSSKFVKSTAFFFLLKYILLPWLIIKLGFYVDYTIFIFLTLIHSSVIILTKHNESHIFTSYKLFFSIVNAVTLVVLFFVKVSFFPIIAAVIFLLIPYYILIKSYFNLSLYVLTLLSVFLIVYLIFNINFSDYILYSTEIISGYKKSMQIYEGEEYIMNYLAAVAVTFIFITQLYGVRRSFLSYDNIAKLILITLAFYYCFSYSFTRGSASLFFKCSIVSIIILMSLYLTQSTKYKNRLLVVAIITLSFGFFTNFYNDIFFLTNWDHDKYRYKERIPDELLNRSETYDVYPNLTSIIYFNNLPYRPRPVFQSYSSYTPLLDSLNSNFISGKKTDNIIFHTTPNNVLWGNTIDERYFLFEEPLTKIEILKNYVIDSKMDKSLFIAKKRNKKLTIKLKSVIKGFYTLGSTINLQSLDSTKLYFFTANINYSTSAKAISLFYKLPHISVELMKGNNTKVHFNTVSELLSHQCVLNKYCSDYFDYFSLFNKKEFNSLENIKSIKFYSNQYGYINKFEFNIFEASLF